MSGQQSTNTKFFPPSAFHFITAVWGDAFIDLFLKVAVPSQLAPRNLPEFCATHPSVYRIYTTEKDKQTIINAPVYSKLCGVLPVEFDIIHESEIPGRKHDVQADCHRRALAGALRRDAALIFLAPDVLFADGSLAFLSGPIAAGKKAVMAGGGRVVLETFLPDVNKRFLPADGMSLSITPPELVRLTLAHTHPLTQALYWTADPMSETPSNLCWRVEGEGFVVRSFHLHPLYLDPRNLGVDSFSDTVDGTLMDTLRLTVGELVVVENSSDVMYCDLSAAGAHRIALKPRSIKYIAAWAELTCTPLHQSFFSRKIKLRTDAPATAAWEAAEEEADTVVRQIQEELHRLQKTFRRRQLQNRIAGANRAMRNAVKAGLRKFGLGSIIEKRRRSL